MEAILLILLIMTVGVVFAWHRIQTRGLATALEDVWRFIANQNSKDVAAYKATRWVILRLLGKLEEQGEKLRDRHEQEMEAKPTNEPPSLSHGFYKDEKGNRFFWDGQKRAYRDYRGRKWNGPPARERTSRGKNKRASGGDWIDWMDRNVHPNTPPWMQGVNRAIYEWLLMMAVVSIVGTALIILFIVAVNMG